MSSATTRTEVEINNFFIFNSQYGNKEGHEHEKILYYHPQSDDIDVQMKNLGLAEAMIQFTSTFQPDGPLNAIRTDKRRQYYLEAEDNYWLALTINVPTITKCKEGEECTEYLSDEVQDTLYQSVLRQAYSMYRLFNGNIAKSLENADLSTVKAKLEQFFTAYLTSIRLEHCDLLNIFNGMQFLPLNRHTFLNVQCFINALECKYSVVKHTAFLYNEHLVWSGIEPSDMQIIYQYLITTLLPVHVTSELLTGSLPRNTTSPFGPPLLHHGRFITGPQNLRTATSIGKIPKVYIFPAESSEPEVFHFIVYRTLSASICLFIKACNELSLQLFNELDEFFDANLTEIVSEIAQFCSKQTPTSSTTDTTPKFIYFNKLNLAYKSTVHLDNKQTGNISMSKECNKLMTDLNAHRDSLHYAGETIVKTMKDYWVVAKVSNEREFYVTLQQKQANLIEISDEVEKLCETELKSIFFHSI